jgi:hypothetical protein
MAWNRAQWSLKVNNADEARKVIKESATGFYVVAALMGLSAFILGLSGLWDAAFFGLVALWLQLRRSRVAAVLLALGSVAVLASTVVTVFGNQPGGRNIVLAVILTWSAVRAVTATFKLPGLLKAEAATISAPIE